MAELTSRDLKRFDLEQGLTFEFFASHISCGGELSQKVLKYINFKQGCFYALLPSDSLEDRLYHFLEGGVLSSESYATTPELYQFVFDFLQKKRNRYVIVDNLMGASDSAHIKIDNVSILNDVKEVCYVLSASNSFQEVKKAVYRTLLIWHSLILLIQLDQEMDVHEIRSENILDHVRFIIIEAYDGEDMFFWERNE